MLEGKGLPLVSVPQKAQPTTKRPGYGTFLLTYLRPQRGRVAILFALLLGGIALQLLNPQILSRFIDLAPSAP